MRGRFPKWGWALAAATLLLLVGTPTARPIAGQAEDAPSMLWQVALPAGPGAIAVDDGSIFLTLSAETADGSPTVAAYAVQDGTERWRVPLGPNLPAVAGLTADGDSLFVVAYDVVALIGLSWSIGRSELITLDAATGVERWRAAVELTEAHPPVTSDGMVFFAFENGPLIAFDAVDGRQRWRIDATSVSPIVAANGVIYALLDRYLRTERLAAIDAATGEERWTARSSNLLVNAPLALSGEFLAVVGYDGVETFRVADGARVFSSREPAFYQPYTVAADEAGPVVKAEVPSEDRSDWERSAIFALDAATGVEAWCSLVEEAVIARPPLVAGGRVFVPGMSRVVALDRATGLERWRIETGGNPRFEVAGETLFVADGGRQLAAYRLAAPAATPRVATPAERSDQAPGAIATCQQRRTTREGIAATAVVSTALFGLSGLVGWIVVRDLKRSAASRSRWTRTTGRITRSGVRYVAKGGYAPDLRYAYTVDGVPFEGKRLRFLLGQVGRREAEALIEPYPLGAEVDVLYDPTHPRHATLETTHQRFGLFVALAIVAILIGAGVYFLYQRPWTFG